MQDLSALTLAHRWSVPLAAEFGHTDVTPELETIVRESGIRTGVLTVQLLGSTGAITTIEYESGALSDLRQALELIAPVDADYAHNARWGDGNGFSHVRSALLKTSLSLPVVDAALAVGTWQQVIAINEGLEAGSGVKVIRYSLFAIGYSLYAMECLL